MPSGASVGGTGSISDAPLFDTRFTSVLTGCIVMIDAGDAFGLCGALYEQGVQVTPVGPTRLRAVTHLDVDAAGIEEALEVFSRVLSKA